MYAVARPRRGELRGMRIGKCSFIARKLYYSGNCLQQNAMSGRHAILRITNLGRAEIEIFPRVNAHLAISVQTHGKYRKLGLRNGVYAIIHLWIVGLP